jgi:hypothetical protein
VPAFTCGAPRALCRFGQLPAAMQPIFRYRTNGHLGLGQCGRGRFAVPGYPGNAEAFFPQEQQQAPTSGPAIACLAGYMGTVAATTTLLPFLPTSRSCSPTSGGPTWWPWNSCGARSKSFRLEAAAFQTGWFPEAEGADDRVHGTESVWSDGQEKTSQEGLYLIT